jgi:hypothetical protein
MFGTRQAPGAGGAERGAASADGWPAVPAALADQVRALFIQAHRRRRRRRLAGLIAVLLACLAAAISAPTWLTWLPGQHAGGGAGGAGAGSPGHASATAVWVDEAGGLHVGAIGAGGQVSQRVAGEADAAAEPLVAAGQRVYWVDPAGAYVPSLGHWSQVVRTLNLRTGRVTLAGAGQTVFLSADRRFLLMSQTPDSLTRTPVTGGRPRLIALPRGWYLPGGDGLADPLAGQGLDTANGVLVQSRESPGVGVRRIAVWNPKTAKVTIIGRAQAVIDAYTPAGAHHSLLAWLPAGCPPPGSCAITITNTASGAVTTVRSPSDGGFAVGGAFSPDGSRLAVFVNAASGRSARLALIDVAAGSLRVVRRSSLELGIDYGWARWLPDGRRLIAGTGSGGLLVDAATLDVRPLHLTRGNPTSDLNYSAAVISPVG